MINTFASNLLNMYFENEQCYHLYNRTNRRAPLFYNDRNYNYFLRKVKNEWDHYFDFLAYCLMPTHFHFMIYVKSSVICSDINAKLGHTLASYTRAINKQQDTHGSLFQQHTKCKNLNQYFYGSNCENATDYFLNCFRYIHQNPINDKLVRSLEDWEFSSCHDYLSPRPDTFCNKKIAGDLLGIRCTEDFRLTVRLKSDYDFQKKILPFSRQDFSYQ